jgi:hypothetical protein
MGSRSNALQPDLRVKRDRTDSGFAFVSCKPDSPTQPPPPCAIDGRLFTNVPRVCSSNSSLATRVSFSRSIISHPTVSENQQRSSERGCCSDFLTYTNVGAPRRTVCWQTSTQLCDSFERFTITLSQVFVCFAAQFAHFLMFTFEHPACDQLCSSRRVSPMSLGLVPAGPILSADRRSRSEWRVNVVSASVTRLSVKNSTLG